MGKGWVRTTERGAGRIVRAMHSPCEAQAPTRGLDWISVDQIWRATSSCLYPALPFDFSFAGFVSFAIERTPFEWAAS